MKYKKYAETGIILLFVLLFLFVRVSIHLDNSLTHPFPTGYFGGDGMFHASAGHSFLQQGTVLFTAAFLKEE